ncbi:MAG: glycosyltransferase [Candidatus Binatia bacterium]
MSDEAARAANIGGAGVVVVGPAPPLRGGIAAHTARLVEHLRGRGTRAVTASYRRLYPSALFPGRSQRSSVPLPPWCEERLDVLSPASWTSLRRDLLASEAAVVLQWWHPVAAPALLAVTRSLPRARLAAVCHNVLPHESLPWAALAARWVLGRCGRVLCHSASEAGRVEEVLRGRRVRTDIVVAPLPCLFGEAAFAKAGLPPELEALAEGTPYLVAAGHLRPYKGIALLARAWALARRPPAARLLLVGESYLAGKDRRELAELVANDPSIVVVERYVEDWEFVRFLDSSAGLVAAHLAATQSGVLPIARALGLPTIVSDAGGLASQAGGMDPASQGAASDPLATAAPAASVVVPAGDLRALAAAIETRLSRPRRRPHEISARRDFPNDWQRVVEAMGIATRP